MYDSDQTPRPREAAVVTIDTPDGPMVTIGYHCDFRAEEEWGVSDLRKVLLNASAPKSFQRTQATKNPEYRAVKRRSQSEYVRVGEDYLAIHTEAEPYRPERQLAEALRYIRETGPSARRRVGPWEFRNLTVAELRAEIRRRGLSAPSKARKDDLVTLLLEQSPVIRPDIYPAWFHYGDVLVLPRGTGDTFGAAVEKLIDAITAGTLSVGGLGSVSPFGTGLTLYDERDLGPVSRKQISDDNDWYWSQMAALDPVKDELRSRGFDWYALGNPRLAERDGTEEVVYWINGHGGYGVPQPFGWYTAAELLDEKFVSDARERDAGQV